MKKIKLYSLLKDVKKRLMKICKRLIRFGKFRVFYPLYYKRCSKKPCQMDKVIFIEHRYTTLSNNYHLLYDTLAGNYTFHLHTHFLREGFVGGMESVRRCLAMIRDVATAKYVFVNEGSVITGCLPIRKETIVTNTWHGCGAFKRFGFSTADLIFGDTRKGMQRYPTYKNYTYVTVSSPEVVWAYQEAMGMEDSSRILPIGTSRTDVFFDPLFRKKAFRRLCQVIPGAENKKVILYAPTFRGRVVSAKAPDMLNLSIFQEALASEYILLIKHHPVVKRRPQIPAKYADFAYDVTTLLSIEDLICVSDLCISDYSSLIYEYSLMERPMLFFAFDLEEYFDWRGFYYDYSELTPGPVMTTNREMVEYIQHIEERFDSKQIRDFREKFMSACDGHATERILKQVFGECLAQHQRQTPIPDAYHLVPSSGADFKSTACIQRILNRKESLIKRYTQYLKTPVECGKVLFLSSKTVMSESFSRLYQLAEQHEALNPDFFQITNQTINGKLKEIASAHFIVLDADLIWLDLLPLRSETKVVQLPRQVFLLQKFGYSSRAIRGGAKAARIQEAPYYANCDLIPLPSENQLEDWKESFGIRDTHPFSTMGSCKTDFLFDSAFKEAALKKLQEIFPEAEGKRILLYLPSKRKRLPNIGNPYLDYSMLYEYLPKDVVLFCHYHMDKMPSVSKYYQNKIRNMTKKMTLPELMSLADAVVGDYRDCIFEFAATQKPLFRYAPDEELFFEEREVFQKARENLPGHRVRNTMELVDVVSRLDFSIPYETQSKRNFFEYCDGHSSERVIAWMCSKVAEEREKKQHGSFQ